MKIRRIKIKIKQREVSVIRNSENESAEATAIQPVCPLCQKPLVAAVASSSAVLLTTAQTEDAEESERAADKFLKRDF